MRSNQSHRLWTLILLGLAGGLVVAVQTLGQWTAYGTLAALGMVVVLIRSYALGRRRRRSSVMQMPRVAAPPGAVIGTVDPSPKAPSSTFADPRSPAAEAFGAQPRGSLRRRGPRGR